jgi:hypothetical protein
MELIEALLKKKGSFKYGAYWWMPASLIPVQFADGDEPSFSSKLYRHTHT